MAADKARKALDKRVEKLRKTKFEAKWHEHAERMRLALGYLAIGEAKTARDLVDPTLAVRGEDTYGDTLEWCARDATALALRLDAKKGALEKAFAEIGAIIDRELGKKGKWLAKPKPTAIQAQIAEAAHLDLDKALWHLKDAFYECLVAIAQDPKQEKALEPLVQGILGAIAAALGGAPSKKAGGPSVDLAKIDPDVEAHPLVRERLHAIRQLGPSTQASLATALDVGVACLVLGRKEEACAFANAVLRHFDPKKKGTTPEHSSALALLLEASGPDDARKKLLEETNYWAWDDGAKAWKEFARDLGAEELEEKAFPSALRRGRATLLQAIAATHLKKAASVSAAIRKTIDAEILPAFRKRLDSKKDAELARTIVSLGAPASASMKPLPSALDPKKEKHPTLKKMLERVAKKPALRGGNTTLDVLVVGLGRAALGRDRDAIAALSTLADLAFAGDYDTWYVVGKAMAARARLSADPKKDLARMEWEPFASMDDEWLDEQAGNVRKLAAEAANLGKGKPSERAFARLAHGMGWAAFFDVTEKKKVPPEAWSAGLDALRELLG